MYPNGARSGRTRWTDSGLGQVMKPSYFCLTMRPFPATPSTKFYYPAGTHETAIDLLGRTIEDGEGIAVLTADTGLGKTLVAHRLLERLGEVWNRSLLTNCRFAHRADLFRAILFDLGQSYHGLGEQELRLALTDFLLDELAAGRPTVLVLDEAQGLNSDLLEELRLLGNLETHQGKAVQIILIGQIDLHETLSRPGFAALQQRVAAHAVLERLDVHESVDFLMHQIRLAGGRPERIMTEEAMLILARTAGGVPRLLNRYAYQSLSFAEQVSADRVDAEVVIETLTQLGVEADLSDEREVSSADTVVSSATRVESRPASHPRAPGGAGRPHITSSSGTVGLRPNPIVSEAPWIAGSGTAPPTSICPMND